jgi:phosphate transport system substrate-binding protein
MIQRYWPWTAPRHDNGSAIALINLKRPNLSDSPRSGWFRIPPRSLSLMLGYILLVLTIGGCRQNQDFIFSEDDELTNPVSAEDRVLTLPSPPPSSPRPLSSTIPLPKFNPLDVEGDLHVTGSDTIAPIIKLLYERFIEEGYAGLMKIDAIGTGSGFTLYCDDQEADVVLASRKIKENEVERCTANKRNLAEFEIGKDAVVIVVHPDNSWLKNATLSELKTLFAAEKWSDVNPAWPQEPIVRFVPDLNSGTLDIFTERVGISDRKDIVEALNTTSTADVDELAEGVIANPYAISFFSYAYYKEYADDLTPIAIDGVKATSDSVARGQYSFSRPLYIYVDTETLRQNKQVEAFVSFLLSHVNEVLVATGYFASDSATIDRSNTRFYEILDYDLP